jgi:intraflagellar transport protein 140
MKAMMKSGDTKQVIFIANIQKTREIYIMAANYLQSLDWRKDPEIMKNIIMFYTKAKSMESLASFYEACAQVEIDEFQDYDKASSALAEAYKCLTKGNVEDQARVEHMINTLKFKVTVIRKFMEAKAYEFCVIDFKLLKNLILILRFLFLSKLAQNAEEGLRDLQQILQVENVNNALRVGDVYALLVEYHANRQRWKQAYTILQEMKETIPESSIRFYVNQNLLAALHRELNIEYKPAQAPKDNGFSSNKQQPPQQPQRPNNTDDDDDIRDNVDYGAYED